MHYTRATGSTGATGSIGGRRGGDDLRRRHVAGRAEQLGADARDLVEEGEHGREGGALPALSTREAQSLLRVTLCTVTVKRTNIPFLSEFVVLAYSGDFYLHLNRSAELRICPCAGQEG